MPGFLDRPDRLHERDTSTVARLTATRANAARITPFADDAAENPNSGGHLSDEHSAGIYIAEDGSGGCEGKRGTRTAK